jgi:hypothetical protein
VPNMRPLAYERSSVFIPVGDESDHAVGSRCWALSREDADEWIHAKALAWPIAVGPGACLRRPRLRRRAAAFSFSGTQPCSVALRLTLSLQTGRQALDLSEVTSFDCDVKRLANSRC